MPNTSPNLLRFADAMRRYGLSRSSFDKAHREGRITKHKLGRAVFIDTNEMDALIANTNEKTRTS